MSAMQRAHRANLMQQLQAVPPDLRKLIADEALSSQKTVLAFPYYSTVRFEGVKSGAGPSTYTVTSGTRKAFNYKIGDTGGGRASLPGNGFNTSFTMTAAETNLLKASETRDNADVLIWGIAAEVRPGSDPALVRDVWRNAYVTMSLSGTDSHVIGRLSFLPSAGGLYGAQPSRLVEPSRLETYGQTLGHMNNGNPTAGNYFRLPSPVRWEANGSGKKDTSLVVSCILDNGIGTNGPEAASATTYQATARAAVASASGSTGIAAWGEPVDGSVFADVTFRLISVSISERSTNA